MNRIDPSKAPDAQPPLDAFESASDEGRSVESDIDMSETAKEFGPQSMGDRDIATSELSESNSSTLDEAQMPTAEKSVTVCSPEMDVCCGGPSRFPINLLSDAKTSVIGDEQSSSDFDFRSAFERLECSLSRIERSDQRNALIISELRAENSELRSDQLRRLLGPFFRAASRIITRIQETGSDSVVDERSVNEVLSDVEELLLEMLELYGVRSVEARIGEPFDRNLHYARRSVETQNPEFDGLIVRVYKQGLVMLGEDRALVPADVSVSRYTQ